MYQLGLDGTGYTNLHNFDSSGINQPTSVIMLNNTIYGSGAAGGNGSGGIFSINSDGSGYTNIYFTPYNLPVVSPLVAIGGTLFGLFSFEEWQVFFDWN